MCSTQERMALYPNILQKEKSFPKLSVIKKLIKISRIIRDIGFGIFEIIQSHVKDILGYCKWLFIYFISNPT